MNPRREEIQPADLLWGDSLNEPARAESTPMVEHTPTAEHTRVVEHTPVVEHTESEASSAQHPMDDTLRSLAQTRARCRHLSERALARSLQPTAPALRTTSGLRPPEVGATDVVTLRPTLTEPPPPPPRGHRS